MKLSILPVTIILTSAFLGGRMVAAEPRVHMMKEFIERDEPETQVAVPESIQKDLYRSACQFLQSIYPDIDRDWMRNECGMVLLKDRYGLLRLHNPWPPMVRIQSKAMIQMDIAFPCCEIIEIGANRPPPGVVLEKLAKPLTLEGAEVRAPGLGQGRWWSRAGRPFRGDVFWRGARQLRLFSYCRVAQSSGRVALAGAYTHVRRSDGFIQRYNWSKLRVRPTVPYEKAAEMAKAIRKSENGPGTIHLEMRYRGGACTPVWFYFVPSAPGGSTLNDTWWDAMTGELLYSKVLHGGRPEKPYQSPKYFTEVNDEMIRRNIEKLIKDRVAELEKKKDGEQGAKETPPPK